MTACAETLYVHLATIRQHRPWFQAFSEADIDPDKRRHSTLEQAQILSCRYDTGRAVRHESGFRERRRLSSRSTFGQALSGWVCGICVLLGALPGLVVSRASETLERPVGLLWRRDPSWFVLDQPDLNPVRIVTRQAVRRGTFALANYTAL